MTERWIVRQNIETYDVGTGKEYEFTGDENVLAIVY